MVDVLSPAGKKSGTVELDEAVFGLEPNVSVMAQVVTAQLAARRAGTQSTKTRSETRGGGAKPWAQKGTGRARAGSSRSPLWRSGAVVHGPQARSYGFKINKQVRKLALKMALSSRFTTDNLLVVDQLRFDEIKTKNFVACKNTLGLKKALIVVAEKDTNLALSARNVPGFLVLDPQSVNVYEILKYPQMVLDQGAVAVLQERLK